MADNDSSHQNDQHHHHHHQHHHHQNPQQQQQLSSGFWTLTRPSKLTKRRNSDLHELHHKVFNISVVGLSGTEKDKGPIGIGKSCLCNRFVKSAADDYHTDHISVLSQSDFSGRVVNNDHWLYWGSVIKSCDGYDLAFNIIEQSEFVDDACFQPFKSGKTEPYFKRCANTKLVSAEKLMYICKNQLGIEREYEQRYLPDGKFNVDGFLCLFDVSEVQGRNINKQIEMTNLIMLNLLKTRKPIVFVTTKHDEASELLVIEAERLINQRDFRGVVPIVETSAQENININMAFLVCAQLIDKTRAKLRVPPYFEAYRNHQDLLNAASEAYLGLIRSTVLDYTTTWQQVCIKLSHNPEFLQYTYLHGLDNAKSVFKNHLNHLRRECIALKVNIFLKVFPDILNELIPPNSSIFKSIISRNNNEESTDNGDTAKFNSNQPTVQCWMTAKEQIYSHPLFNKYFIRVPSGITWYDTELLQSQDNRIPSDWLDSDEAYSVFQQRNLIIESELKRQTTKEMFAQLLTNIKVPVGKPFIELKHIFAENPNFQLLTDQELFEIYVEYQNNLLQQARADFQELLLENAEHLHHLTSTNKVIRQEDIKTINSVLQHDERYQALDRFDQDRTLMMIRHLSFLHSQISEQCPSYPKCVEPEIERLLITKAKTLVSKYFEKKQQDKLTKGLINPSSSSAVTSAAGQQQTCDLVIFGPRRPSQQLILALNVLNSRAPKGSQYQITFTVFDNVEEVDNQVQKFRQSDTKPRGCFGIFTNQRSLEHVSYTLEKFLILNSQMQIEKNQSGSPPIVMLYAADITLDERTMLALENEGQQVADRFKCPFMNVTAIDQYRQHQQNNLLTNDQDSAAHVMSECASLDYACVDAAFNVLKEAISRRVCFMELYNNQDLIPRQAFNPDARILMCLLCGEPFSNELFMWKNFLNYEDCYVTSSKSICLRIKMENGQEKFIEVTITSYTHGAFNYREDLLHGFMLVCSIERKASISILNAFSFSIPCTPVLVMAIKSDSNSQFSNDNQLLVNNNNNNQLSEEESSALINEAQCTANRMKGQFELLNLSQNNDNDYSDKIQNFLHNVIKRKPIIEKAYELGDNNESLLPQMVALSGEDFLSVSSARQSASNVQESAFKSRQAPMNSNDNNLLSNNGNLINNSANFDKNNLSDESESYATIPQQNISTFITNNERDEEPPASFNELYATRPLPPIPTASIDQHNSSTRLDRQTVVDQSSAFNLTGSSNIKPTTTTTTTTTTTATTKQTISSAHHSNNDAASSSNNDISSTDDDTEDSTDNKKHKPKPGKLDLSQFDNITNAIGKLNVQPQLIKSSHETQSKFPSSQKTKNPELTSQESGFFKNRSKKTNNKNRILESAKSDIIDTSSSSNKSVKQSTREKSSNSRISSEQIKDSVSLGKVTKTTDSNSKDERQQEEQQSEIIRIHSSKQKKFIPDKEEVNLGNVRERLANFKSNEPPVSMKPVGKVSGLASTFVQQQLSPSISATEKSMSENKLRNSKPFPKPTPRSSATTFDHYHQHSSTANINKADNSITTSSFGTISPTSDFVDANNQQQTSALSTTTPTVVASNPSPVAPTTTTTTTVSASSANNSSLGGLPAGAKRINNPRQNHGRAVAPPQLPPVSGGVEKANLTLLEGVTSSSNDLNKQLSMTKSLDDSFDANHSPIAQRLLQYTKDHKVSELNSPYESDSETTQQSNTNISKSQKQLLRGQSLASEHNNPVSLFTNSSIDSSELINSRGAAIRQLNEILANKQPPGRFGGPIRHPSSLSAHDKSFYQDSTDLDQQQTPTSSKKNDKEVKKDKKKSRDDEKMEKRRLKEEERLKRQEKKLEKSKKTKSSISAQSVGDDGIPLFIKRCIEFIEQEGLDAEGIYRVPGNRAHVDAFVQKFKENPNMSILESDIPVNAVATALKDFLSKKWGPIIPMASMNVLTEISNISERDKRVEAVRDLIKKLPQQNYNLLKYVFSHFVKVSHNHSLNSMDSKNLAICWWPTLLPLHFNDMIMFEQMRPHLEESIQTMIDQYNFVFDTDSETSLAPPMINN